MRVSLGDLKNQLTTKEVLEKNIEATKQEQTDAHTTLKVALQIHKHVILWLTRAVEP